MSSSKRKKNTLAKTDEESAVDVVNNTWGLARTGFQNVALTHIMRHLLSEEEEIPDSEGKTQPVAVGFVRDVIKLARKGNPTALTQVLERIDGKVANTSVSVNVSLSDDERVSKIIGLIKRRGTQEDSLRDESSGESGA